MEFPGARSGIMCGIVFVTLPSTKGRPIGYDDNATRELGKRPERQQSE